MFQARISGLKFSKKNPSSEMILLLRFHTVFGRFIYEFLIDFEKSF